MGGWVGEWMDAPTPLGLLQSPWSSALLIDFTCISMGD